MKPVLRFLISLEYIWPQGIEVMLYLTDKACRDDFGN